MGEVVPRRSTSSARKFSDAIILTSSVKLTCHLSALPGHKDLASTMIYAKAHDQTVADDYFAAMQRVEQRLEIVPAQEEEEKIEVVKVQLIQVIEELEQPVLCLESRILLTSQLREIFFGNQNYKIWQNNLFIVEEQSG